MAETSTQRGLSGTVQVETTEAGKAAINALVLPQNPRRWLLLEADMQSPPCLQIVQIVAEVPTPAEEVAIRTLREDGWMPHVGYEGLALVKQGTSVPRVAEGSTTGCERHADCTRARLARAEQENAELLRLLTDLATEAADLDAWPSSGRTRALKAAQDHLAAVTT